MSWPRLRPHFELLARAWLSDGARAVEVREQGVKLASWPDRADVDATLCAPVTPTLEWRVAAPDTPAGRERVRSEATLLASVARLETELEELTVHFVEIQDQLLALNELTLHMRPLHEIPAVLSLLVEEATRLLNVRSGFALLQVGGETRYFAEWPEGNGSLAFAERLLDEISDGGAGAPPSSLYSQDGRDLLLVDLPMRDQGSGILGVHGTPGTDFTSADRKLASAIAARVGSRLESMLLHEASLESVRLQTEIELAREVQMMLLPRQLPDVPGLDWHVRSRPALHVGGDFYDVVAEGGRPIVFSVGDVSGKGLAAALLMTSTRTVLQAAGRFDPQAQPHVLVEHANADLYDDLTVVGMFATVVVGRYTPGSDEIYLANSGHSPVLYRPREGSCRLIPATGVPLGILPSPLVVSQRLRFAEGDLLIAATDGLSEATRPDGAMFGIERLLALVDRVANEGAEAIGHALQEAVDSFSAGSAQDDDQTLLILKRVQGVT